MDDQVISIFLMTLHLFISMKKASLFHSFSCINGITLGTNQLPGPLGFHTFSVWTIMLFAHVATAAAALDSKYMKSFYSGIDYHLERSTDLTSLDVIWYSVGSPLAPLAIAAVELKIFS